MSSQFSSFDDFPDAKRAAVESQKNAEKPTEIEKKAMTAIQNAIEKGKRSAYIRMHHFSTLEDRMLFILKKKGYRCIQCKYDEDAEYCDFNIKW